MTMPLWNWPGSRWWRVDLHTHSPASHDFQNPTDQTGPDWTQWVQAIQRAGLDAAAITDHNTAAGISELQRVAQGLDNPPALFPGVELTASDGTHLLLLLDPSCTQQQHIEDVLSKAEVLVDRRGQADARSKLSIEKILDMCGDNALIVGAHINGPAGLLELVGLQRRDVLRHQNLAAVEVCPHKPIDESWVNGSKPEIQRQLPQLWCSDGHSFATLGQRFTWVKMTCPNLEGLRLALLDGPTSLRPADRNNPGDPNAHTALAIESITVDQAKFMGRESPVRVLFNPWLNAIIGGRGTGKSTLIDFCRKALRRDAELSGSDRSDDGSLKAQFDRRMRVPASRQEEGLLTEKTCIKVVYRKDDERFVLSWSQDATVTPLARLDKDKATPQAGDIRERFPVRIYNQKQLFALAQDPNALLTVIDDSEAVRKADLDRPIQQLADRYLSLRAEARVASRRACELPQRQALLVDVRHKLDVLERGGQARILSNYRMLRQQNNTWSAIRESVIQALASVERSAEELAVADLERGPATENDSTRANLQRMHETLWRTVAELRTGVRERVEQARQAIDRIDEGEDAIQWRVAVAASQREYDAATAQLAEEGIGDPSEYTVLLERAAGLERETKALQNEQGRVETLDNEASAVLGEYRERRTELSDKRKCFTETASSDVISVAINPYANRGGLAEELVDMIGIERFESDREELAKAIQPEATQPWSWKNLDEVVAKMRQLLAGEWHRQLPISQRFVTALQKKVTPERIDRLALYLPDDAVEVSFKDRPNSKSKPLTQGSPGQQTAALLAFVLGYGSEPIILDQPEDDLDNSLIYELLVSRLQETKTKRQVIVVTHNPNIVVHGDAEFVLSLRAGDKTDRGQSRIACQGGLQQQEIRDEICRVMEGGREAFERRYQRIMPPGGSAP